MKKILSKMIQLLCTHKFACIYVYGISADFKCVKCAKTKKGYTPINITEGELASNRIYFKEYYKPLI